MRRAFVDTLRRTAVFANVRLTGETPFCYNTQHFWRDGRVAEGNGLLNRHTDLSLYRGFESPSLRQSKEHFSVLEVR